MTEIKIKIKKPEDILKYKDCPKCKTNLKYQQGKGYNYCPKCKLEYLFVIN